MLDCFFFLFVFYLFFSLVLPVVPSDPKEATRQILNHLKTDPEKVRYGLTKVRLLPSMK